jgi:hypothetical protein
MYNIVPIIVESEKWDSWQRNIDFQLVFVVNGCLSLKLKSNFFGFRYEIQYFFKLLKNYLQHRK